MSPAAENMNSLAADSAPNAMFGGDVVFRVRSYDRFRMEVELKMKNAKLRRRCGDLEMEREA